MFPTRLYDGTRKMTQEIIYFNMEQDTHTENHTDKSMRREHSHDSEKASNRVK